MDAFVTEAFTLLGIGLSVIGLRLYVRISTSGIRRLKADDYLMVVAAITYSIETYLAYSVGAFWHGLANNAMTDEQRRLLDPASEEYHLRVNGSKTQVAGWSTYTFLLWTIKAAMCAFYIRLTDGLDYEKRIYAGFGIVFCTWIAVLLSILLGCRPLEKNWQIYPDPGNACQPAISRIDIFVTLILNVVTDIYLMSIPIPMLWKASLRPLKKAGLILLFSGGVFVTVAAILRCVLIVTDPVNGAQKAGSWAVRETFVAVVTSNMPMITPLVARCFRPLLGSLRSRGSSANCGGIGGGGRESKFSAGVDVGAGAKLRGFVLENKNPRRGMGPRSVNPIPDFTVNASDEHINDSQGEGSQKQDEVRYETDLEAGVVHNSCDRAPSPLSPGVQDGAQLNGGILKQTSVEVIETRDVGGAGDKENIGDYYLVEQSRRDLERMAEEARLGRRRRSSVGLGKAAACLS